MCIQLIYIDNDAGLDDYQLILVNQRDEKFDRPTKPAGYWEHATHCISGRDWSAGCEGGTWFGASTKGKIGILTNVLCASPGINSSFKLKVYPFLL